MFAARIAVGALFVYASIDKLLHPQAFAQAIYNYQMLPDALINPTAIVLPWLEWLAGICLLLNVWVHGATVVANLLLVVFLGSLVFNLSRGLNVDCGCFSTAGGSLASWWTVLRDLSFLLVSGGLLVCVFTSSGTPPTGRTPL